MPMADKLILALDLDNPDEALRGENKISRWNKMG